MHEIALFVEDDAHERVVGGLVRRVAEEQGIRVSIDWRSARGGHGRVAREFKQYLRGLERSDVSVASVVVVATDANCKRRSQRSKEINVDAPVPIVQAIPDPHVERWLLLDGAAFKEVFGAGCRAPDRKCRRGRYKELLVQAIHAAGTQPLLGGIEYAEDIVNNMDLARASRADSSLAQFLRHLRAELSRLVHRPRSERHIE